MSKIETIPSVWIEPVMSEKPQTLSQITETVKELNEALNGLAEAELNPYSDLLPAVIGKVIEAAKAR
jgi:hypothetical protein